MKLLFKTIIISFKLLFSSSKISLCLTFGLIMINSIMGIFVGLGYYLLIFGVLVVGLSIGLLLFNSKDIFSKKKVAKISKTKKAKTSNKKQVYSNELRRKIS